jgi:ribosomal protein S18 acetylase RimI-like enzyme
MPLAPENPLLFCLCYTIHMQTNTNFQIAFHSERRIDAPAVRVLYDLANWWPHRQPEAIAQMLERDLAIGIWDSDRLIGFARAVTDGYFRAYIEDVFVHPLYHRQGLALEMLTQLINALHHIETVSLFCSAELIGLYEQLGFRARRSQVVMHRAGSVES